MKNSPPVQELLQGWVRGWTTWVGLERYSNILLVVDVRGHSGFHRGLEGWRQGAEGQKNSQNKSSVSWSGEKTWSSVEPSQHNIIRVQKNPECTENPSQDLC